MWRRYVDIYQVTRRRIPEESNLRYDLSDNLKSHLLVDEVCT